MLPTHERRIILDSEGRESRCKGRTLDCRREVLRRRRVRISWQHIVDCIAEAEGLANDIEAAGQPQHVVEVEKVAEHI